ncbi:hypothetical protein [Chryseobacterium koreense]|uniref:hypothetical protein n=1 Tax=Chryseobacterium koreense TaxID=232216 RepID=UPI0026F0A990|nr:hypothetical protein [Chryseobacterium koreense]
MKKHVYPLETDNFYHVFNQGIDGCKIFFDNENYDYFLKLLENKILSVAELYCYCLLPNHFHLLLKVRPAKEIREKIEEKEDVGITQIISKQFSNFFNSYSQAINKKYHRTGKLFEQPFRRIIQESDQQLMRTVYYIHNNPRKHNLHDDIFEYPYSSLSQICKRSCGRIDSLKTIQLFGDFEHFEKIHSA